MDLINILIHTIGGLGIFILGMKTMTEALEMVAGKRIKKILKAVSCNRVIACLTGTGITAIIQSSSATTVMIIGFVEAGLMSLQQAIGVTLGANIGTTVTAQLISFKLTEAALPAIAIGVYLKYFFKKQNYYHIGEIILGFGLLFFGLVVMKDGLGPIKSDPAFIDFFTRFTTENLGGILLCVVTGAILTITVQSSSATIGLTMVLATQGLVNFPTAIALVLGENIGTTITAQLATIGLKNINAHRTARAHAIFNIIGVIIIICIFPFFLIFVEQISLWTGTGLVQEIVNNEYINISRYLANGHTLFNVLNAFVFLIFLPRLAQLSVFLSPKEKSRKDQ